MKLKIKCFSSNNQLLDILKNKKNRAFVCRHFRMQNIKIIKDGKYIME